MIYMSRDGQWNESMAGPKFAQSVQQERAAASFSMQTPHTNKFQDERQCVARFSCIIVEMEF